MKQRLYTLFTLLLLMISVTASSQESPSTALQVVTPPDGLNTTPWTMARVYTTGTDSISEENGRKLDKKPTKKGVYILNGKKTIVK